MDRPPVKGNRTGRWPVWKNYAVLAYSSAVLLAILITLGAIISDHNVRFDLTPGKRYSLSEFDKRVLSGLRQDVRVVVFVRTEDPSYLNLVNLLDQVAAFTPRLSYRVVDVNKEPGLARQYGISNYGEVVVESGGRRRDLDSARSELLIPVILQVSQQKQKHIYFTVGHGEKNVFDTGRNLGYSRWRDLLQQNNYLIDTLSLFAGDVPEDATAVVVLGPRQDLLDAELNALRKYLERGGHLVVFIDPNGSPSVVRFLRKYHLNLTDRVVVDPAYRLTGGEILTTQIPIRSSDNVISKSMSGPAVFSVARPVWPTGKPGAPAPGQLRLQRVSDFLRSSDESWASGDPRTVKVGITEFKAGRDVKGPIPVAVEVDFAPSSNLHIPLERMARIVVFGSSAFPSNQFIQMLGNSDLAVSTVNELAGDEMLISSREHLNRTIGAGFYVTDKQARGMFILGAVVEPLILIMTGIAVFARRRFFA